MPLFLPIGRKINDREKRHTAKAALPLLEKSKNAAHLCRNTDTQRQISRFAYAYKPFPPILPSCEKSQNMVLSVGTAWRKPQCRCSSTYAVPSVLLHRRGAVQFTFLAPIIPYLPGFGKCFFSGGEGKLFLVRPNPKPIAHTPKKQRPWAIGCFRLLKNPPFASRKRRVFLQADGRGNDASCPSFIMRLFKKA